MTTSGCVSGLVCQAAIHQLSRQDVIDGDLVALLPVDDHGDLLTGQEVRSGRMTARSRIGVDIDPAVEQVDDPVDADAAAPVDASLLAIGTRLLRQNLHHQPRVGRLGEPMPVVGVGTPDNRDVWFRRRQSSTLSGMRGRLEIERRNAIMTIHLPADLAEFIHDAVRSGRYAREDDVIRDAVGRLKQALQEGDDTALQGADASRQGKPLTKQEFQRHLAEIGLINQAPETASASGGPSEKSTEDEDEILSERMIRERLIEWLAGFI